MATSLEPLKAGYDVDDNAVRFSNYFHVLRELGPALAAAARLHLATLDPIVDEPSLRLLTQILHRQERHVVELAPERAHPLPFEDLGSLGIRLREVRELRVMPPL